MRRRCPLHTSTPTGFRKLLVVDKVRGGGGRCQSRRRQGEPAAGRIWGSASYAGVDPPPNRFDNPRERAHDPLAARHSPFIIYHVYSSCSCLRSCFVFPFFPRASRCIFTLCALLTKNAHTPDTLKKNNGIRRPQRQRWGKRRVRLNPGRLYN